MAKEVGMEFAFFEFLRSFYVDNRGIIRNRYREITKKYLDYNDKEKNPDAFLRTPQFEALEMYVFVKEFMNNQQMYQMFDDWSKRNGVFSDRRFYDEAGQMTLYDVYSPKQYHDYFLQIKKYAEDYPNYIFALTMGLGKTILMATCIFYEFLLASKWPRDDKYCHNALVFAPDKTVLQSLKEIVTFDKSKVVPPEYIGVLDANIKVYFLEDSGTTLNTLDGSKYNIIISNTQKIILKAQHKEKSSVDKLFSDQVPGQSVLDDVLGILQEISNNDDLMSNQRFEKLTRLSQMGIYVDEAHHMFGADLAEVAKYFPDIRCTEVARILRESEEGIDKILVAVNEHNDIIYDKIVPTIFEALYRVNKEIVKENVDVKLLKKPKEGGYYEFSGNEDLIIMQNSEDSVVVKNKDKSFHADTYVFDSKPELQLFLQLLANEHVKKAYFTGMFTADQTDFYVPYIDPESNRLRKYYPDFLVKMDDGSYLILEVKGDNMIDDPVVKAKGAAAEEVAVESSMKYEMLKGTDIMEGKAKI